MAQGDHQSTATYDASPEARVAGVELIAPGTELGARYEIVRILGTGGYAVVYLARDRQLKTEVALKVLRGDRTSADAAARLRREASVSHTASSPNLVRIFDIEAAADALYLTMEYVPGHSLKSLLQSGPLRIDESIRIASEMLCGLADLHAAGVIHRDVKPGNVLLTAGGSVKLADFGLARRFDSDESHVTATGAIIGTAEYLSPEQLRGHEVDHRTDLYACGIVLYEMLTGESPFAAAHPIASWLARIDAAPPDVRRSRKDCPRWLARIVSRLLAPNPKNRYASAAEALEDLRWKRTPIGTWRKNVITRVSVLLFIVGCITVLSKVGLPTRRFANLVPLDDGVAAIGTRGQRLWEIRGVEPDSAMTYALARDADGRQLVAAVLRTRGDLSVHATRTLSFVDPLQGTVVRRVPLPSAGALFPLYPDRFIADSIEAVDLDHDGVSEIVITFDQVPDSPSYTVLYEMASQRVRLLFVGSGHHRFALATDLDGDGQDEILLAGINNGFGWYNALAALRVIPGVNRGFNEPPLFAVSPDRQGTPLRSLMFYALLPPGFMTRRLPVSRSDRTLRVNFVDGPGLKLDFGGFVTKHGRIDTRRAVAREAAYAANREAQRAAATGDLERARETAALAVTRAAEAREPLLVEAMQVQLARLLIRKGESRPADDLYSEITSRSSAADEIAYDAARSFHLAGAVPDAIRWYIRAFQLATQRDNNDPYGATEGLVYAYAEQNDWASADRALDQYAAAVPPDSAGRASWAREFVRIMRGGIPRTDVIALPSYPVDVLRYWDLEFAFRRGADPATLLKRIDPVLESSSRARSAVLSLHAELLSASGRKTEAGELALRALRLAEEDRSRATLVRAHYALIAERARRLRLPQR